MNRIYITILLCFLALTSHTVVEAMPLVKVGNVYHNPVIHADYSDPDVIKSPDGKTYYMTASSFQCIPGLPILKSHDLINWTVVNHALDSVPPVEFYGAGIPRHGKGVWAPCIRYHNGKYYIYWGDPDFGIFMVNAEDPEGHWSSPVLVREGKGLIDPSPFWDEDGKAYLANGWAASRAGLNSIITISEMSPDGDAVISQPRIVYDGNDGINHTVEGPKMYKRGEYYYLMAPAGGVADGWQLVMRSKNVYGPYESKIVMAQGNTDINGPHQGAWINTDTGEDWFIHFQDKGLYGRVIHLNPVKWIDNWPVIGIDSDGDGCGEPVTTYKAPAIGNGGSVVGTQDISKLFQWHSNYSDFFGFPVTGALMRIYSYKTSQDFANMWEVPNLWMMKFPAENFIFETEVEISSKVDENGVSSGIIVMGHDYCRLGLTTAGNDFVLQMITCNEAESGSKEKCENIAVITPEEIYKAGITDNMKCSISFRITVEQGGLCHFAYSKNGKDFITLNESFQAKQGKWIGAKIGFYSIMPNNLHDRGWIDIKSVNYEK